MFLATYGKKCNVPFEKVKKDILEFVPRMDTVIGKTEQHFTKQNALDTLNAYKESDKTTLPIKIISDHTELQIMRNKRNKRNTMNHFEKARAVQEKDYPNGSWRNEDGRSEATAENTEHYTKVQEWRKKDPN